MSEPSRSSATSEVDDWIKSVQALKAKRLAEDEARNRQLEEDILRERRARQERRATRTRSISPTKSLISVPNSPQMHAQSISDRSEDNASSHAKNAGMISAKFKSDNSDNIRKLSPVSTTERLSNKDENSYGTEYSPINRTASSESYSPRTTSKLKAFLEKKNAAERAQVNDRSNIDAANLRATSHHSNRGPLTPMKADAHKGIGLVSSDQMSKLASIFAAGTTPAVTRTEPTKGVIQATKPLSDGMEELTTAETNQNPKLNHMTRSRARKQKSKQPSVPVSEVEQRDERSLVPQEHVKLQKKLDVPPKDNLTAQAKCERRQSDASIGNNLKLERQSIRAATSDSMSLPDPQNIKSPQESDMATISLNKNEPASSAAVSIERVLPQSPKSAENRQVAQVNVKPTRGKSLFNTTSRSHRPTKSIVSMTSAADLIRSRANSIDNNTRGKLQDSEQPLVRSWSIKNSDLHMREVLEHNNVLCHDELRVIKTSGTNARCYAWTGVDASNDCKLHLDKNVLFNDIQKIKMGEEPPEFMSCFKDDTIITEISSSTGSCLFRVKSYLGGFAIDEVPCNVTSLCSGFVYALLGSENFLWLGEGCHATESRVASTFLTQYKQVTFTTIMENDSDDTPGFWSSLGGRARYASSAFWRLKRDISSYTCKAFVVGASGMVTALPTLPNTFHAPAVHIIDTFFEIYIHLPSSASGTDVAKAIKWVKTYCRTLNDSRPFNPMALALCPNSRLPRDLRAAFRMAPAESNTELRVLEVSALEVLLNRTTYTIAEFRQGLAFDVDYDHLERFVDKQDFVTIFEIDRQVFDRLSAAEQRVARCAGNRRLAGTDGTKMTSPQ